MAKNSQHQIRVHKRKTRKDAVAAGRKNSKKFAEKVDEYLAKRKLYRKVKRTLEAVLGRRPYRGQLRASDIGARDELRKQTISLINAFQKQNPHLRFFFITLLAQECDVSKKAPILWLRRLRGKADKALRDLDIEGAIAMIEPDFIPRPPDTHRPVYSFHVHALAWAEKGFDLEAAREQLAESKSWSNAWGIPPTDIGEITTEMGVAAWWAYYLTKLPVDAKNVIERADGTMKLMSTQKGFRGDAVLRLVEGLAQCHLAELFFGVKDGKNVRGPIWRATTAARKLAHPDLKAMSLDRLPSLFKRFWRRSRADHHRSWKIIA